MSYLPQEPQTFINVKLTDTGRRLLSLGRLTFEKSVFSDREINYGVARNSSSYCIPQNRVLSPKDDEPIFPLINFDGSTAYQLGDVGVFSSKDVVTANTQSIGAWIAQQTGSTSATSVTAAQYKLDAASYKFTGYTTYDNVTGSSRAVAADSIGSTAAVGDLIQIRWYAGMGTYDEVPSLSNSPFVSLWYRVLDTVGTTMFVDRNLPDLGTGNTLEIPYTVYPQTEVESYWGSGVTKVTKVWNMNIVRTASEIGTDNTISGYTAYGSIEYNGTKQYLGFEKNYRSIGIIHYTNLSSGNTYAEQLVEGTVKLDIPHVLWHHASYESGVGTLAGLRLSDAASSQYYDSIAGTTYRILYDGSSTTSNAVGRVYHKLKIFVITDPELLTALSYKSNRNWSLPKPNIRLVDSPAAPLTTNNASGIARSNYSYLVTYRTENTETADSGSTLGYRQAMHCNYIQKIDGLTDANGLSKFINVGFPAGSFPYLRNEAGFQTYSGTGWSANKVQLLVREIETANYDNLNSIPTDGWKLVSSGLVGNGVYTGETSDNTIDPTYLQAYQFVISKEDYDSGTTYTLDNYFTEGMDRTTGLTYGDETFFLGNIQCAIRATVFKTVITLVVTDSELNSSNNETFDGSLDEETYVTGIGILNADNELVAVGKPSYPLPKSAARYLTYQLQLDF